MQGEYTMSAMRMSGTRADRYRPAQDRINMEEGSAVRLPKLNNETVVTCQQDRVTLSESASANLNCTDNGLVGVIRDGGSSTVMFPPIPKSF